MRLSIILLHNMMVDIPRYILMHTATVICYTPTVKEQIIFVQNLNLFTAEMFLTRRESKASETTEISQHSDLLMVSCCLITVSIPVSNALVF